MSSVSHLSSSGAPFLNQTVPGSVAGRASNVFAPTSNAAGSRTLIDGIRRLASNPPSSSSTWSDIGQYCDPEAATYDTARCSAAVTSLTCSDLTEFKEGTIGALANLPVLSNYLDDAALCSDLSTAITLMKGLTTEINTAAESGRVNSIDPAAWGRWYSNVVAPCISGGCANTATPVATQDLIDAPRQLADAVLNARLSKPERFILAHLRTIIVVVGILLLGMAIVIILLLFRKPKCPTIINGYAAGAPVASAPALATLAGEPLTAASSDII
ncbi:hypothetical protein ml_285 [Mollivirus sibericum]|uniref:hypothetical protein n=1 Tax=Mollivirus sibericum TaxID=1678078 RepID=UPI0006B2E49B|nr:hypothetical protein ml_285 [Mollivirus sibericum]ALD62087.1 hypothetical protein ml_285 [Mollivirus sibericum]